MSLERYKTQVLLLHSQQSTLDTLSAGFNDQYSVHCATSGTEALNTLGDTPIHVFVSAQDLPGMSGLDAIREAKKRSPDTIGILLAGTDKKDGLEALVGAQEVFQIVRGTIEPVALLDLIESATKSVHLIALSESANDQRANVDEPITEHIVMETSENGSSIISDGTGTLPVLRPHKIEIAPGVGGRQVDVLVLTKDEEFLATIKDSARGLHNVHHAVTPTQAEDIVRDHKVGVLVTDAAMVGSNIEGLTQRLRAKRARIVAIVAGRRDDGELLMDLINRGHVYRFLLKPVSPGRARLAVEASVKHHMEAPDEAFKPKIQLAQAAPRPKPVPATPPQAREKPKPTPVPVVAKAPVAAPKPVPPPAPKAADKPRPRPAEKTAQKIEPTISDTSIDQAFDSSLDSAFGETSSFTETMTGIAVSVGKSISSAKGSVADSSLTMLDSVAGTSSPLRNSRFLAIGGGVIGAAALSVWLLLSGGEGPGDVASEPTERVVDTTPANPNSTRPTTPPSVAEPVLEAPAQRPVAPPPYARLLDEARAARDAGNLILPVGSNALELYSAVVAQSGGDPIVRAEFNDVVGQVLGLAESAILARNAVDAKSALDMAGRADPQNPRLTFLSAQLAQLHLRETSDQARLAIREGRFEEAATLISEARRIAGIDLVEINLLTEELQASQIRQAVGETLALANQRLESGQLIAPANDNARYFFQQGLLKDPENQAAQQGLITIASKLVLQALGAIDNGQLDDADTLLGNARQLDPSSRELSSAVTVLADARETVAEAARQAEQDRLAELRRQQDAARQAEQDRLAEVQRQQDAARQAEQDRLAEVQRQQDAARQAEAERVAAAERQQAADRQAQIDRQAELDRLAQEQRLADARREAQLKQDALDRIESEKQQALAAESARLEAERQANRSATASPLGVGAAAPARTEPVVPKPKTQVASASGATTFSLPVETPTVARAASTPSVQEPVRQTVQLPPPVPRESGPAVIEMVPVSHLTRTNYVGPVYPRAAQRRSQTGSVDVGFIVTTDGRVRSMTILASEPGDTFDQAAMDAVEQWRFEPVVENGVAVEKQTAVRLAFDLQ